MNNDFSKLEWETIEEYSYSYNERDSSHRYSSVVLMQRAKVFGGWLVRYRSSYYEKQIVGRAEGIGIGIGSGEGGGLTFIPDPLYQWKLT